MESFGELSYHPQQQQIGHNCILEGSERTMSNEEEKQQTEEGNEWNEGRPETD